MPERLPTAKPTVVAGTNIESGTPNTGQVPYTIGGSRTFNKLSGTAGGDANIFVGGGRLDLGFQHGATVLALSGQAITFYDSAVAVSGGPLAASGHKVVGVLGFNQPQPAASGDVYQGGNVQNLGFVFTSGLCHNSRSGQLGFTVSYTIAVSG